MRLGVRWRCDLQKLLVCFRSISLSRERLGVADAAMHSLGPAPSYAEKSAIQNRIAYLYNQHVAPQSRTYQEGEVSHVKMRARTRLLAAPCTARTRRRSSRPGPMLSKPATAMRPWARSAASRRTRFSS